MNICLLEVAMCEKCRRSHFQLEGGVEGGVESLKNGGRLKNFKIGGRGVTIFADCIKGFLIIC